MDKEWIVEGSVWKVGNNVNTESITPSKWLHEGHELLMQHIGELLIPEFPQKVQKGDFWVGGTNLGCSSSRNAPLFLKDKGIAAVICNSASRIFYRNAVNSGLPIFTIGPDVDRLNMGDRLKVNIEKAVIENLTNGEVVRSKPFPDFIMAIIAAGGIGPYILSRRDQYELLR